MSAGRTGRPLATALRSLSRETESIVQQQLEERLLRDEVRASLLLRRCGFSKSPLLSTTSNDIDMHAKHSISAIIRDHGLSLEAAVQLVRNELNGDTRPNKALDPIRLGLILAGYPHVSTVVQIASHGIKPDWLSDCKPVRRTAKNHQSFNRHIQAALKSIREGQDTGKLLVVDASLLEQWPNVRCSPFGAVEKSGIDPSLEIRLIHDLSHPPGASTNDDFDKRCLPDIDYQYVTVLALRIEALAKQYPNCRIRILKGDVKGAYRHLMTHALHVHQMAGVIPERDALVIDLAAPFGWSGSPKFYAAFGRAISWLVTNNSPSSVSNSLDSTLFFGYEWVDDHILIEIDINDRLELAESTLRHAMLAVLGPRSINETKFSKWSSRLVALGLVWDTTNRTLSIPQDKLDKGLNRIQALLNRNAATRKELEKVLGSLRYIALCLRSAKPFFQEVHAAMLKWQRFGRFKLTATMINDLQWFRYILRDGQLSELPLRMFGQTPEPDLHLYMDASDMGLAVLNPARNEFIKIRFDEEERQLISTGEFSINVREHLCIALAVWTWAKHWSSEGITSTPHIRCWSDNASAVAWSNKLSSSCPAGQEINRAIGLGEAVFNIRISAAHLPGAQNTMADAASRSWCEPFATTWSNFSVHWKQVSVPQPWRKIYKTFSTTCSPNLWPRRRRSNTQQPGSSGPPGVRTCDSHPGSPTIEPSNPTNSHSSQYSAGNSALAVANTGIQHLQSSPRYAISRGIINATSDSTSVFSPVTNWQSQACVVSANRPPKSNPSRSRSSELSTAHSISQTPTTGYCGALRSWVSSICSGAQRT